MLSAEGDSVARCDRCCPSSQETSSVTGEAPGIRGAHDQPRRDLEEVSTKPQICDQWGTVNGLMLFSTFLSHLFSLTCLPIIT